MDMITKTRRRFMTMMMLVTAIIIITALVAVYWLIYNSQEQSNRQRLNSFEELNVTENGTVSLEGESTDAYVVERTISDIGINFTMLVDESGKVKSVTTNDSSFEEDQIQEQLQTAADIAWQGKNYSKVELFGKVWQYSISPAVANFTLDGKQQLEQYDIAYQIRFVDITESVHTLKTLALTLCVIGVLLLVFFFFFSLFFSKRAIRPLIEVMEKQQQFVSDASHELKTPVSIIKANCSVLYANEQSTVASQKEWLDNIVTGADRMTDLIQDLIALAKIQGTDNEIIKSKVLLEREINESLDLLDVLIEEKSLTVDAVHCGETIWSDPDRVRQVLGILLDNAIKYANAGGTIRISVSQEKKYLCLSVFNTGDGIAKEDLEKVFDRFYRVEGARSQDGSFGLGLSIAQTVMEQLGGSITAESVAGESSTFTLRFPKKQSK